MKHIIAGWRILLTATSCRLASSCHPRESLSGLVSTWCEWLRSQRLKSHLCSTTRDLPTVSHIQSTILTQMLGSQRMTFSLGTKKQAALIQLSRDNITSFRQILVRCILLSESKLKRVRQYSWCQKPCKSIADTDQETRCRLRLYSLIWEVKNALKQTRKDYLSPVLAKILAHIVLDLTSNIVRRWEVHQSLLWYIMRSLGLLWWLISLVQIGGSLLLECTETRHHSSW